MCEKVTKLVFVPVTVQNVVNLVKPYEFPLGPFIELTSVEKYNNDTEVYDLLTADDYILYGDSNKLKIDNLSLPYNKYRITYRAGYEAGELPEELQQAILYQLGDLYENRNLNGTKPLHTSARNILVPYMPTSNFI